MTIETYKTEYKALKAAYETGKLGIGEYIEAVYALKTAYCKGKGSMLTPVVL